ncbi:hypothetical protein NL108_017540 [Boleophthalmus pectinirostris]|nr:hypothetical protein NL108_017540 [Boleophthalmus pectinirostris]
MLVKDQIGCFYASVGLLILPMKRMLLVQCSRMKMRKGLSMTILSGMLMGITSIVVAAAASVPVSSTLSIAWCVACIIQFICVISHTGNSMKTQSIINNY